MSPSGAKPDSEHIPAEISDPDSGDAPSLARQATPPLGVNSSRYPALPKTPKNRPAIPGATSSTPFAPRAGAMVNGSHP
ncbi:hypothetical protein NLI96_g3839 [Meripilus lineatus]|uniref:Uncharacterized protein n=1 Tax=Meripilus lineatus TaxID=2056292 RepID=A0AAD5VBG7_9APHY|nr:hypothetical protein NLI96_g3839 [Physisporinus lineatus]